MDAVDTGYIYHKRRNVRQQVNTKNKKTAAARPQGGGWRSFFKVILMSLIEVQNLFLKINFDIWDRLGHV